MVKYSHILLEVPDLDEALQEISDKGSKLVSSTFLGDSQQLLLIVEEPEKTLLKNLMEKKAQEDEK
jgi:predicted enzyme related to lactoylglutathione lyase